ncbi:extracellular solute-binding protein [Candidatus Leptofilum sp.]|uniref:extracellular solute-binding protein n=1 Tax=Candidatus Leptofilum sp. TaxID=3241576 RepID=UPI003B5933A2
MNNKKWYILTILFLLGALFLSACGGSEPATDESADEPATTTDTAEEETMDEEEDMEEEAMDEEEMEDEEAMDDEEEMEDESMDDEETEDTASEFDTTITIWSDELLTPVILELKESFEAEFNIGLIVENVPDRNDQFPIAAPAGEGPDIIMLPHDRLGGFYESGLLAPVDLGDKAGEFNPFALQAWTFDGQLVGVPYNVENTALFYNTDMIDTPPQTWDELIEMGAALVDSGEATYATALAGTTYDAFPLQTAFGGYVFGLNDDGTYNPNDLGIDSEGMIAAGNFIQDNVEAGYISNSTDNDTAKAQFAAGEIPFLMYGPWGLDDFRTSGVPYAIASFPSATEQGVPFSGVWGFAANALGDNVLLAQTFLTEVLATPETMELLSIGSNRPSAWLSVENPDPDLAAFAEISTVAEPMPAIPEMGSVWGSWGDAFSLLINGEQEPADALANAATQIRDLIGGSAAGMVNIPGSWQAASGLCGGDWDPACEGSALTDNGDGTYSATYDMPAGDYEVKVALDGGWDENYGVDGAANGDNITFTVAADGPVTFTWDSDSKILTVETGG